MSRTDPPRPHVWRLRGTRWTMLLVGVLLLLLLASCAPGPNDQQSIADQAGRIAGFWLGLWHGIIAPVTFVVSLFNDRVGVYEVHNNGHWYDFGFVLGVSVLLGSGGRAGARKR